MTLCGWSTKQTIPLSVLARNQTKAWARNLRRDRKWVRERESGVGQRNPEEGSWRCRVAVGSRHQTAEETSWHEIASKISVGRPVKMSQHSSWFVEFSLEIHASVSLQGMQCHNLTFLHFTQALLFVCSLFFFSHSLDCISCSHEEICDAPIGTTRWSPAKIEMVSKKLM